MPKEFNYYCCSDEEDDDIDFFESDFKATKAPFWDGTEWSDEDIGECPGRYD